LNIPSGVNGGHNEKQRSVWGGLSYTRYRIILKH
jgi:hypothetical protein